MLRRIRYIELTLICVGEENKINSLRELVAFQHELIIFTANEEIEADVELLQVYIRGRNLRAFLRGE